MHLIGTKKLRAMLSVALVGLVFSCGLVFGQGTSGSLSGQVTDPTGAAIVGANVTLTNIGTNYVQVATTDATGVYQFKLVPPRCSPIKRLARTRTGHNCRLLSNTSAKVIFF